MFEKICKSRETNWFIRIGFCGLSELWGFTAFKEFNTLFTGLRAYNREETVSFACVILKEQY